MSVDTREYIGERISSFFSDLCDRNRDKIKEIKEKESSFINEVFKKYDAIKNKEHLLKLAGMVVKNEERGIANEWDENVFNGKLRIIDEYLSTHQEEWRSKNDKYKETLKDCKDHIDEITSNKEIYWGNDFEDDHWVFGLIDLREAVTCFINGKTINTDISLQLAEDLLKDDKVVIKVFSKSSPYKYDFKYNLPIDDTLPYIFCGISPKAAEWKVDDLSKNPDETYNWIPNSLQKAIKTIGVMLNDTDTLKNARAEGANEVEAVKLINEVKEKYPEFYELAADWLREKIQNVEEDKDCTEEKFSDYELVQKSIKSMTLESGESIFMLKNKEKIMKEIRKHMEGDDTFKLASGEEVKASETRLEQIVTILRGSEKSKRK
jgi:hypothetical protein